MALVGLSTAFLGAVVADLKGNEQTRPFTRRGFLLVALWKMGLTLSGVVSFGGDLVGVVA